MRPKPVVLCILDGWGMREDPRFNAPMAAKTPNLDRLTRVSPLSTLEASELHVGLPEGQMGNSEVGHMNIGSGRVVMQDLPRIDQAARDGGLATNPELVKLIQSLKKSGGACHLLGLLSPGGVHAHQDHAAALARILSQAGIRVHIHAFLDGRDTPPKSALEYLAAFEKAIHGLSGVGIATIGGRYYGMDRDKRWERVEKAWRAMALAEGGRFATPAQGVEAAYAQNTTDEFILPAAIGDYSGMQDGDGILMFNFRADRARQILTALLDPGFNGFARPRSITFAAAAGLVEYSSALNPFIATLFPPQELTRILGEVVAEAGLKQLRIAETEKYAHVTFFFNGGREEPFAGEERILIPSPKVATYDLKPEMSAYEVTDALEKAIATGNFDLIVVNYANADMVGHTGVMEAAIKAVEALDACIGRLYAAVEKAGGVMMLTSDHGNIELMRDEENDQPHTAHTLNLVPFMLCGKGISQENAKLENGRLCDIAPTVLRFLELPQPAEMTGACLYHPLGKRAHG